MRRCEGRLPPAAFWGLAGDCSTPWETLLSRPYQEGKSISRCRSGAITYGIQFIMYVLRRSLCRRQPCSPCTVCLEFKPDRLSSDNRYDGARSWYQNFCVLFDSWIVCLIFKTRKQSRHALRPVPHKLHLELYIHIVMIVEAALLARTPQCFGHNTSL